MRGETSEGRGTPAAGPVASHTLRAPASILVASDNTQVTDWQETTKALDRQGFMRNRATSDVVVPEVKVAASGFERSPYPLGNSHIEPTGAAKSGALYAANQNEESRLNEVTTGWPELAAAIKTGIPAMMRAGQTTRHEWDQIRHLTFRTHWAFCSTDSPIGRPGS